MKDVINKPKTITTFLINGNPNGLKTIFVSNKICKALVIPRTEIEFIKNREEISRPSLYFLINEEDDKLYIGESENFYERIKHHISNKEFWITAIQFFSQNNDLTKADVKYLEHLSIKEAKEIGNFDLDENKQTSSCPHLPEHEKARVDEFFDDVKLITGFLGYDFFETIEKKEDNETFYCQRSGIDAKGFYQDGKFVILSGSKIARELKSNYSGHNKNDNRFFDRTKERRNQLLGNNFKIVDNDFIIINKNITFESPSAASCFCIGMSSNGWTEWKNIKGITLDAIIRKKL